MILLQWFGGSLVVGTALVRKIEIEMRGHVCIKAVRAQNQHSPVRLTLELAPDFMVDCKAGEMQIGRVAQNTGLSIDTIRFYEKQGLVHAPQRSSGGYRVFDERDVERFRFIGRA